MKTVTGVVPPVSALTSKNNTTNTLDTFFNSKMVDQQAFFFPWPMPPFIPKASIGDRVWLDSNGNGIQDANERGVAGVKVELIRNNIYYLRNEEAAQTQFVTPAPIITTTDANGNYKFDNVAPGSYSIRIHTPEGYSITKANVGNDDSRDSDIFANGHSSVFYVATGQRISNVDAGLVKKVAPSTGFVGDRVWLDSNGNGVQDANEQGVAGVTVHLYQDMPMYIMDASNGVSKVDINTPPIRPIQLTAKTDANGHYQFDNVPAGRYFAHFEAPNGYKFTRTDVGDDSRDSDASAFGNTRGFSVEAGKNTTNIDAGLVKKVVPPTTGSVGDRVWLDSNGNGVQDANEQGMAGVKVELIRHNIYYLDNQNPGVATQANIVAPAPIITTTDANGNYKFDSVAPGSYGVRIHTPKGYSITKANVGNDDNRDSDILANGNSAVFSVAAGQKISNVDAGLIKKAIPTTGSIGDRVWLDSNGNGVQDANELGMAGVKVELCKQGFIVYQSAGVIGSNGEIPSQTISQTVTDKNGNYHFDNVAPTVKDYPDGSSSIDGNYYLRFTSPEGFSFTTQHAGSNTNIDSDVSSLGRTQNFVLHAGEKLDFDAGLVAKKLGSISGVTWSDSPWFGEYGVRDQGDNVLANITVKLYSNGQLVANTVSDAKGNYRFANLKAGDYQVQFDAPHLGYATGKNQGTAEALDSDINPNLLSDVVSLKAGEQLKNLDAGFSYRDYLEMGAKLNGNYLFEHINPGQYKLHFNGLLGTMPTKQNAGVDSSDSDIDHQGYTALLNLKHGDENNTVDAGFSPMMVYFDEILSRDSSMDVLLGSTVAAAPVAPTVAMDNTMSHLDTLSKLYQQQELMV